MNVVENIILLYYNNRSATLEAEKALRAVEATEGGHLLQRVVAVRQASRSPLLLPLPARKREDRGGLLRMWVGDLIKEVGGMWESGQLTKEEFENLHHRFQHAISRCSRPPLLCPAEEE